MAVKLRKIAKKIRRLNLLILPALFNYSVNSIIISITLRGGRGFVL